MQVTLAGHNLDAETIALFAELTDAARHGPTDPERLALLAAGLANEPLTPETLSAAYARISRSPMSVSDLRRDARASVSRARQSNERIVFGLGHASVAEHAVFNLDITGVSRLALETLESHRLASYTEASQRYIALTGDYVTPREIAASELEEDFHRTMRELFATYRELIALLEPSYRDLPERDRNTRAREDARYVLPLACRGQVGVTLNARVAESVIRNCNESPLEEVRALGRAIGDVLRKAAPSLIRYVDPREEVAQADRRLKSLVAELSTNDRPVAESPPVTLITSPQESELHAVAALLFRAGYRDFSECLAAARAMDRPRRQQLLLQAHGYLGEHDPLLREMELGYFTFAVTLSASAFAQMKRHRMSTIITQPYQPSLGVTIPPAVTSAGGDDLVAHCVKLAGDLHTHLLSTLPQESAAAAQYALTNAHRRRIIFQANARELTHLARLRLDQHAQWDIRALAGEMIKQARDACPALLMFAAGKDRFPELRKTLFPDAPDGQIK